MKIQAPQPSLHRRADVLRRRRRSYSDLKEKRENDACLTLDLLGVAWHWRRRGAASRNPAGDGRESLAPAAWT
jgi:hypothetical protein